jgi:aminodeoxychorismate synthase component I
MFERAAAGDGALVWLDSALGDHGRGGRSLLALELEPVVTVSGDLEAARVHRWGSPHPEVIEPEAVWSVADAVFAEEREVAAGGPGWCGWVAYEAGALADPGLPRPRAPLPYDAMRFDRIRVGLVREGGETWLEASGASETEARRLLERWHEQLLDVSLDALPVHTDVPVSLRQAELPCAQDHARAVQAVRERIAAGDVYQACLTFPLWFDAPPSLAPHYLALRRASGGDFGGYVRLGGLEVASTSPERFLRVVGDSVTCRPMKGTRARGETADADAAARSLLELSEKDRAENVMIVDLMRNDLGRVCEVGSVEATSLYDVETYATVHQMTSTVTGRLRADVGPFGLLKATFPPGSMTGAPKIAACNLLSTLEAEPRGVYSGSVGWLGYDGVSELSVVIRTLQRWGDRARWDVGGGVVWDSTAEGEWEEALSKAAALERSGLLGHHGDLRWR